jgi:bacterioferritin-associated ferredoxin
MYICICKAVTDGQIREAISQGACTRKDLIRCLSVGRDCGKCNAEVRELLNIHASPPKCRTENSFGGLAVGAPPARVPLA